MAISLYCALKYEPDFDMAVRTAVNHRGDSDSTGAVTGNILGAALGYSRIPRKYTARLELRDVITEIAADLYAASSGPAELTGTPEQNAWGREWCEKYLRSCK